MRVEELIAILQTADPEARVVFKAHEDEYYLNIHTEVLHEHDGIDDYWDEACLVLFPG